MGEKKSADESEKINILDRAFMSIGKVVAKYPWPFMVISVLVCGGLASGFRVLESENRPEKQWVPDGAPALEQKLYVDRTWPATQRFNFWIAKCRQPGCNLLEPKYVQRLDKLNTAVMNIVVDGDALRTTKDYNSYSKKQWDDWGFGGNWSFEFRRDSQRKCFQFGPFCGKRTMLDIFRDDSAIISGLTMKDSLIAANFWEGQENFCPITIARANSPCVNTTAWLPTAAPTDCQLYKTTVERDNCRASSQAYCNSVCPTMCFPPGAPNCRPMAVGACADNGCITLQQFNNLGANNGGGSSGNGSAPESAFAFEPFKLRTVLSSGRNGPTMVNGRVTGAEAMFGFYALSDNKQLLGTDETDPIALEWEKQALCVLGVKWDSRDTTMDCPADDLLEFQPNFQRSLSDEFGAAVRGDVGALGVSYMAILGYMTIMLSRRDTVHAMMGMSFVTLLIVGLSFAGCQGLGGYLQIPNNQLNNNIPFLLLGLGVDDAFVLTAEYYRIAATSPGNTVEQNIAATARHGGVSIFITSVTDALAFLVGANTVLPALSWFCKFAGMGVILCFILQLTLFLPALAVNAKRARANRFDILCCFKAKDDHPLDEEQGCCCCCKCKSGLLESGIVRVAKVMTSKIGTVVVLLSFTGLLAAGVVGSTRIYKDFKLEWFFPSNSYVNTFFRWNEQYFASGTPVTVYTREFDYHAAQGSLMKLHTYFNTSRYVDVNEPIEDWHYEFLQSVSGPASTWASYLAADGTFKATEKSNYYAALHEWYSGGQGVRYRTRMKWKDVRCGNDTRVPGSLTARVWDSCNPDLGLVASRFGLTLKLEYTNQGQARFDTMTAMRAGVADIMSGFGGSQSFPYSFEFLYWEEVGIIDAELVRNLLVCGAVVLVIVALLIPHPRIAAWVVTSIALSVLDLIGFMYWWGVTISGVSTVYILISVGLAVDYSAHIAHMFVVSTGTSQERAIKALERIGGSVFNGVVSTLLAVLVIGFSTSYVFVVFFKALFLTVVFGGLHGLVFLPTILALFGGDNLTVKSSAVVDPSNAEQANNEQPPPEKSVVPVSP